MATGQDFVAREIVTLGVVSTNTVGVTGGLEGFVSVFTLVLEQVTDIALVEIGDETGLDIRDFLLGDGVFVVVGGLVDEALVEESFKENVEVAHEAGVVAELVLGEDSHKAVVALFTNLVLLFYLRETEAELDHREVRQTEDHDRNTVARVGLSETLEDLHVEGLSTGRADSVLVLIEPQVVGTVGTQVRLFTV